MSKIVNFRIEEKELEEVDKLLSKRMIDKSELLRGVFKFIKDEDSLDRMIEILNLKYDEKFIKIFFEYIENMEKDFNSTLLLEYKFNNSINSYPFEINEKNIKDIFSYVQNKVDKNNTISYITKNNKNIVNIYLNKLQSFNEKENMSSIHIKVRKFNLKGLKKLNLKNDDIYKLKDNIIENHNSNNATINLFCGTTCSGKSTLIINLLKELKENEDFKILNLYNSELSYLSGILELKKEETYNNQYLIDFITKLNIDLVYIETLRTYEDLELVYELNKLNISVISALHSEPTTGKAVERLKYLSNSLDKNQNIKLNIMNCILSKTNKDKIICITTYEKYNKLNLDNNQ